MSVVISTRNAEQFIYSCLQSIKDQTLPPKEIILVDRDSQDDTKNIGKEFTNLVYNHGPERSAQRNFGAKKAQGNWLLFIDADMVLGREVIEELVSAVLKESELRAVVIPEESFGTGFLTQVKIFERSFYLGDENIEAPRFIEKQAFLNVGGFDEKMVAGEDWDLKRKLENSSVKIGRIKSKIFHNEGKLTLKKALEKKFYYGRDIKNFLSKNLPNYSQVSPLRISFFKNPRKLVKHPVLTFSLFSLKFLELSAAFFGLIVSLISRQKR